ncbi:uncharacterized protein LOC125723416 [Brienomyrus brachyistius]|uniref:uncharacterized protein LOC125722512 n=1 Tax=Brienomyrus brachyistius TaxID=42636 RepID=UPI0020B43D89|nr:uncharacterized protein LOC125722512 [Brienomyrus brachyistius]XP_048854658.1 uncharacterized protein LOC125722512 [Brienomyrus brachyistius]XP_048854659.1 uncharacterized protein LOC125722512 [Brienomyrus brachyistius]XP_048855989.1 uncharacterized protein LOC125723416 [Brienomyrus brachyistius]
MEGTEAGISMMDMLNGGEENGCEVGVNVEEVKGGGGRSAGNAVEYVVSQRGRTWLEPIQEEELEEDEETDEELQEVEDTDAATVDSWQCMAAYVARIWLQTLQEDGPEENEEADVVFQQAEDADATTLVRFQCMVASEDRSQLLTIPEEGPEEEDETEVMKTDKTKEDADAAEKIYREEEVSFHVNAEDLSEDDTEKSHKKKKKKMKWCFFCCPLPFRRISKRQ